MMTTNNTERNESVFIINFLMKMRTTLKLFRNLQPPDISNLQFEYTVLLLRMAHRLES